MKPWTTDDLVREINAKFQREAEEREPWCAGWRGSSYASTWGMSSDV